MTVQANTDSDLSPSSSAHHHHHHDHLHHYHHHQNHSSSSFLPSLLSLLTVFQQQQVRGEDAFKMAAPAAACGHSGLSGHTGSPESSEAVAAAAVDLLPMESSSFIVPQLLISAIVITCFVCAKTFLDNFRKRHARISVVIVGAGPTGLTSLLVASKSERVSKIYLYEELTRHALMAKPYQIAFDVRSVHFLKKLGVDFDNIEGCWDCGCFFTRLGVFQEYVLSIVHRLKVPVDLHLGTKFTKDVLRELDRLTGRKLVLACDGSDGPSARILGLNDDFVPQSCKAYGAVAALLRPEEVLVPIPERQVHNLHFDLTAYGSYESNDVESYKGFSFKVFGTSQHRLMCLLIPKSESPLIKCLRTVLDRSLMRNIFLKCFNTYKSSGEGQLSEPMALKHLRFSPRLFEVKLSQRVDTTAYFPNTNMFVCVEGDAARCYNIHTGMDVNMAIRGLMSLSGFISSVTIADSEHTIERALLQKSRDGDKICKELTKTGLWDCNTAYRKMS